MRQLPQPHEGIAALLRENDPVLESEVVSHMIGNLAQRLKRAYLFGGQSSYPSYEQMLKPAPGDLVMVTDRFAARDLEAQHQAIGYLIEVREEWQDTDEEWAEAVNDGLAHDDDRQAEPEAYYIQYGPNHVCRWVNCEVIKVF